MFPYTSPNEGRVVAKMSINESEVWVVFGFVDSGHQLVWRMDKSPNLFSEHDQIESP